MEVVSAREFRSNQGKYLTAAQAGQSVLLTSRYGNFKITPISDEDMIIEKELRGSLSEAIAHSRGEIELPLAQDIQF